MTTQTRKRSASNHAHANADDSFDQSCDFLKSIPCPIPIGASTSVLLSEVHKEKDNSTKKPRLDRDVPVFRVDRKDSLTEKSLGPFETFPKQRLALQRVKELSEQYSNLRIFSYEVDGTTSGERKYLVTTVNRFWPWYEKDAIRHLYELIPEVTPCRLYFDLEYNKDVNPDIDSMICYRFFLDTVRLLLKEMYDVEVDEEKNFLALDSSTKSKFSCHVITHLPDGLLFPSSTSIRSFADRLRVRLLENPPQKIMNSDGDKETVLFDQAVYTKNRNFRLFLSSKAGKSASLVHADYCRFYRTSRTKIPQKSIFLNSLCVPMDVDSLRKSSKVLDIPEPVDGYVYTTASTVTNNGEVVKHSIDQPRFREGSGSSPYPYLDEFLLMMLRKWKENVYLRQWKLTRDASGKPVSLSFYPANCRYCFNIGRSHKSNGVYWTVNLIKMEMWQRCFDPDCRGFMSNIFPIPRPIKEGIVKQMSMDEQLDAPLPDDVISVLEESKHELSTYFDQWDGVFEA